MAVRKGDRYCRGPRAIARRRWAIAVGKGLLPYIYNIIYIPVSKGLVPWAKGYCRGQKLKFLLDFQAGQLIVKPPGPLVSHLALQAFTKHKPPLHRKHTHVLAQRQNDISTTWILTRYPTNVPTRGVQHPSRLGARYLRIGLFAHYILQSPRPINYETEQLWDLYDVIHVPVIHIGKPVFKPAWHRTINHQYSTADNIISHPIITSAYILRSQRGDPRFCTMK